MLSGERDVHSVRGVRHDRAGIRQNQRGFRGEGR